MTARTVPVSQCSKPSGLLGRFTLWRMNASHSKLTDWGLGHVTVQAQHTVLDVGCGGGRTVSKLAALASLGKVCGVDYSEESVAATRKTNARWIDLGRVDVRQGSVSQLPFPDNTFDLVTAVETHFFWPDLPNDMRQVFRVTKPGGTFILIAEVYKGADTAIARLLEKQSAQTGLLLLTVDEHRQLLATAGYTDIQVIEQRSKGWITALGKKPQ